MPPDYVALLPIEIWAQILVYLPDFELRDLVYLHPVFCHFARTKIWRKVKLCSLEQHPRDRLLQLLEYPNLTSYIREVEIVRPHQHHLVHHDRSHWLFEMGRVYHEISRTSWLEPVKLVHQVLLGPRKIIHLSKSLLKRTERIDRISINFLCHSLACPQYDEDFKPLLAAIGTLNPTVQYLKVSLQLRDLPLFAKGMADAAPALQDLRTCVLYMLCPGKGTIAHPKYITTFPTFLEPMQTSLRTLVLIVPTFPPGLCLIPGLELLRFPHLTQLHLTFPCHMWSNLRRSNLQNLLSHMKTLRILVLAYISMRDFPSLWSCHADPTQLPPLESLHVEFLDYSHPLQFIAAPFRPFVNSLTTLSLQGRTLQDDEVVHLLQSLSIYQEKPILRKLRLSVTRLSPQLMDILAERLDSLKILDLTYDLASPTNDGGIYDEREFLRVMADKRYYRWRLQWLSVYRSRASGSWDPALEVLKRCIPRVQQTGAVDWSEFSELHSTGIE